MADAQASSIFGRDLQTFLRRTLSGYVYVLLIIFPFLPRLIHLNFNIEWASVFLIFVGVVIGELIYLVYHYIFGILTWSDWRNGLVRRLWGLDHILELKKDKRLKHDRYRRAFWDKAFFINEDQVQKRILSLFSTAHAFGTTAIAIFLALITRLLVWLTCGFPVFDRIHSFFVGFLVVLVFVLLSAHRRTCRDGGALEMLFLNQHKEYWNKEVELHHQIDEQPSRKRP